MIVNQKMWEEAKSEYSQVYRKNQELLKRFEQAQKELDKYEYKLEYTNSNYQSSIKRADSTVFFNKSHKQLVKNHEELA